jgi:hypothetical protein
MNHAVLVGPGNDETALLDEQEYRTLKRALAVVRSEQREPNAILSALRAYTGKQCTGIGPSASFFTYLMMDLADNMDEVQRILVQSGEDPTFMRHEEGQRHAARLKAFLKVLQDGKWLADFLDERMPQYAGRCPTPLEVMQSLIEAAAHFDTEMRDAKRMVEDWPQLNSRIDTPESKADLVTHAGR